MAHSVRVRHKPPMCTEKFGAVRVSNFERCPTKIAKDYAKRDDPEDARKIVEKVEESERWNVSERSSARLAIKSAPVILT